LKAISQVHRGWRWLLMAALLVVCGLLGILVLKKTVPGRFVVRQVRIFIRDNYSYRPPVRQIVCEPIAASPLPRFEGQDVAVGGKLYVLGGFVRDLKVTVRSDVYDPSADTWDRIADLPIAVTHAGFAADGETIWMAGGFLGDHPGKAVKDVWRYNLVRDEWTPGPSLPEERASAGLVLLGRNLHYIGGLKKDRQTDSADHWVLPLEGSSTWTSRAPLPMPRNHLGLAVYDGKIYALGGQYGHDGASHDVDDAHVYDPHTDSWREIASLRRPRSHFEPGTFIAGGKIVIVGGRSNWVEVLYDISAYDPVRDAWEELPGLPLPLRAPLAKAIGDDVFIGQGGMLPSGVDPRDQMIRCTCETLGLKEPLSHP
jgi:hypothetical protein